MVQDRFNSIRSLPDLAIINPWPSSSTQLCTTFKVPFVSFHWSQPCQNCQKSTNNMIWYDVSRHDIIWYELALNHIISLNDMISPKILYLSTDRSSFAIQFNFGHLLPSMDFRTLDKRFLKMRLKLNANHKDMNCVWVHLLWISQKKRCQFKAIKLMVRLSLYTLSCLISLMCNCIIFCTLYLAENHLKWFSIANILKSFDIANDFQISKLSNQDELLPNRLLHG